MVTSYVFKCKLCETKVMVETHTEKNAFQEITQSLKKEGWFTKQGSSYTYWLCPLHKEIR